MRKTFSILLMIALLFSVTVSFAEEQTVEERLALLEERMDFLYRNVPSQVTMDVYLDGEKIEPNKEYYVTGSEKIFVIAYAEAGIATIGYRYEIVGKQEKTEIVDSLENTFYFDIPEADLYDTVYLEIEAVSYNDNGSSPNTVTKTGWKKFILKYY